MVGTTVAVAVREARQSLLSFNDITGLFYTLCGNPQLVLTPPRGR